MAYVKIYNTKLNTKKLYTVYNTKLNIKKLWLIKIKFFILNKNYINKLAEVTNQYLKIRNKPNKILGIINCNIGYKSKKLNKLLGIINCNVDSKSKEVISDIFIWAAQVLHTSFGP